MCVFYFFLILEYQTLSAADLCDPEISALIASKLREFHDLNMPGPKNVFLWDRLRYVSIIYYFCRSALNGSKKQTVHYFALLQKLA